MGIQTVGIIGAGTMGNGIAQVCALAGLRAVMVDISDAAVGKGLATVSGSLDRLVKKDKLGAADKDAAIARIQGSTNYDDLKAAQIVAVFMHLAGERLALIYAILLPPLALLVLMGLMALEGGYTFLSRTLFFH